MALSNQVFQAGAPQNLVSAGLDALKYRVNPYEALAKGYDDQQKRNLQLQQYREAKLKADMATALYPHLRDAQIAELARRTQMGNSPNPYQPQSPALRSTGAQPVTPNTPREISEIDQWGVKRTIKPGTGLPPTIQYPQNIKLRDPGTEFFQGGDFNPQLQQTPVGIGGPAVPGITGRSEQYIGTPSNTDISDSTYDSINPFGEAVPEAVV